MTTTPATATNSLAISSLVLGLVGLAISALAAGGFTVLIGAVAVVLGVTGRTRANTLDYRKGHTMAVLGLVAGALTIALSIFPIFGS